VLSFADILIAGLTLLEQTRPPYKCLVLSYSILPRVS
jgi:hypothetical protein